MKKAELLKEVVVRATDIFEENDIDKKLSQKELDLILKAYSDCVLDNLNKNKEEKIPLLGIGAFTAKHVAERTGTSALSGEKWSTPEHYELKFTVSGTVKTLK